MRTQDSLSKITEQPDRTIHERAFLKFLERLFCKKCFECVTLDELFFEPFLSSFSKSFGRNYRTAPIATSRLHHHPVKALSNRLHSESEFQTHNGHSMVVPYRDARRIIYHESHILNRIPSISYYEFHPDRTPFCKSIHSSGGTQSLAPTLTVQRPLSLFRLRRMESLSDFVQVLANIRQLRESALFTLAIFNGALCASTFF